MENIPRAGRLPLFIWMFHGRQDSAVPLSGSEHFVDEMRKQHPAVNIKFDVRDGEHGLDNEEGTSISTDWIKEGITELLQHW